MICKKIKLVKKPQNKLFDKINNGARCIYNKTISIINETCDLYNQPLKYDNFKWMDNLEFISKTDDFYVDDNLKINDFNWLDDKFKIINDKFNIIKSKRIISENVFFSKNEIRNLIVPDEKFSRHPFLRETPSCTNR